LNHERDEEHEGREEREGEGWRIEKIANFKNGN
jgi:hypothetical protein